MKGEYIVDLLERMAYKDEITMAYPSSSSISWKAYREAEQLQCPEYIPILVNLIQKNPEKKHQKMRDNAYFILGKLLAKYEDNKSLSFFINQLGYENNKYILSQMLDRLKDITIPDCVDIIPIIVKTKSDQWLVFTSAISVLKNSRDIRGKDRILEILNQPYDKKYKYAFTSSLYALGTLGNKEDIPLLEKYKASRIKDIKDCSQYAISKILQHTNKSNIE